VAAGTIEEEEIMEIRKTLLASSLLLSLAANGAHALPQYQPVASEDLSRFVGKAVLGEALTPLGVVTAVDEQAGVVGVVGPHGEFALMHTSVLARNGLELRAATISIGELNVASKANSARRGSTLIAPHVTVNEPAG
jgi:hypothetical protein